jgi:cell division protein FtsI/penicillin-binding protein 2
MLTAAIAMQKTNFEAFAMASSPRVRKHGDA